MEGRKEAAVGGRRRPFLCFAVLFVVVVRKRAKPPLFFPFFSLFKGFKGLGVTPELFLAGVKERWKERERHGPARFSTARCRLRRWFCFCFLTSLFKKKKKKKKLV